MEQYKNLHYLVEELIKVGHLEQYVRALGRWGEEGTTQQPLRFPQHLE